jgi:hypothetical protein
MTYFAVICRNCMFVLWHPPCEQYKEHVHDHLIHEVQSFGGIQKHEGSSQKSSA